MHTRITFAVAAASIAAMSGCAQNNREAAQKIAAARAIATTFPDDFAGTWRGTLNIHNAPGAPRQSVGFTLEIGDTPDEHGLPWRLTYEGQPTRDYRLQTIDAEKGAYLIDERNGITMPAHFLNDTLISRFTVSGQTLLTRQQFFPDRIEHEILAGSSAAATDGVGVQGLRVTGLQRATLRLVEPTP